jgi:hypothetical protein
MVLEKGTILWGTPAIDITNEVIRAYNGMNVKVGSLGGEVDPPTAAGTGAFGSAAARGSTITK